MYPLALSLRVVVDVADEVRDGRGPAQLHVDAFEQVRLVVARQDLARGNARVVRGPDASGAVQRVVGGRRRERLRFQQGVQVGDVLAKETEF